MTQRATCCPVCSGPWDRGSWRGAARACLKCRAIVYKLQIHGQAAVRLAKLAGLLPEQRSCTCVDCGAQAREYDHRDYFRPLDVQPVCRRCNARRGQAVQLHPGAIEHIDLGQIEACPQ